MLHVSYRYTDVEQYYIDGSSEGYVPLIRTPTLYLASQDDPFVGRLPIPECSANPNTVLAVTSRCARDKRNLTCTKRSVVEGLGLLAWSVEARSWGDHHLSTSWG